MNRPRRRWWLRLSNEPPPHTVKEAVALARAGALAPILGITVEKKAGDKFDRVVEWRAGEKPQRIPRGEDGCSDWDEGLAALAEWLRCQPSVFTTEDVLRDLPALRTREGGVAHALEELARAGLAAATELGPEKPGGPARYRSESLDLEAIAGDLDIPF